jgi:hypothetical protein
MWSVGTAAQDEQLVLRGEVLKEQVPAGFQPGYSKSEQDSQPTNHAAEDSGKPLRSLVFSDTMRFLQRQGFGLRLEG